MVILIQIKHLSKTFSSNSKNVAALNDINLEIDNGDIFGIIGMSGAGKSTLLRCLTMLEKPTQGDIYVDGKALSTLKGTAKRSMHREMGVVFQGYNLLMQKNVTSNIIFPLKLAGVKKDTAVQRANELLKIVDLEDKALSYPSQLSGGQKQRVALARALATNPNVLLCDEPTSALDPLTTQSVLDLLIDINKKLNVTIIIITHDIEVVDRICNKVAVLDNGLVAETGTIEQVIDHPQSNITKRLLTPVERRNV